MSNTFKKGWYMISDESVDSCSAVGPFYCKQPADVMRHAKQHLNNLVAPTDPDTKPIKIFHIDMTMSMMPAVSLKKEKLTLKK